MKKLIESLILVFAAVVSVATSKKTDAVSAPIREYGMASNCSNATYTNQSISVQSNRVISPADATFLSFGLPTAYMTIASDAIVSATSNGVNRECTYSFQNNMSIYTCKDNGVFACQVSFTSL